MYESGEDYLEAILMTWNEKNECHAIDVARKLNVSKPSVSRAMGILKEDGYIFVDESLHINLTEKGRAKAEDIYDRHQLLTEFLQKITGVDEEQAEQRTGPLVHPLHDISRTRAEVAEHRAHHHAHQKR